MPRRQRRQPVGQRIAEQQAERSVTTKPIQKVRRRMFAIDRLLRRHRHDLARRVELAVDRGQQVESA